MKIDIKHIAKLSNIPLKDHEAKKLEIQLEETINYIKRLNEIDTTDIEPTYQTTNLENITRGDETAPSLSQEDALKNSKCKENGFFKVKSIFEQD